MVERFFRYGSGASRELWVVGREARSRLGFESALLAEVRYRSEFIVYRTAALPSFIYSKSFGLDDLSSAGRSPTHASSSCGLPMDPPTHLIPTTFQEKCGAQAASLSLLSPLWEVQGSRQGCGAIVGNKLFSNLGSILLDPDSTVASFCAFIDPLARKLYLFDK